MQRLSKQKDAVLTLTDSDRDSLSINYNQNKILNVEERAFLQKLDSLKITYEGNSIYAPLSEQPINFEDIAKRNPANGLLIKGAPILITFHLKVDANTNAEPVSTIDSYGNRIIVKFEASGENKFANIMVLPAKPFGSDKEEALKIDFPASVGKLNLKNLLTVIGPSESASFPSEDNAKVYSYFKDSFIQKNKDKLLGFAQGLKEQKLLFRADKDVAQNILVTQTDFENALSLNEKFVAVTQDLFSSYTQKEFFVIGRHEAAHSIDSWIGKKLGLGTHFSERANSNLAKFYQDSGNLNVFNESNLFDINKAGHSNDNPAELFASMINSLNLSEKELFEKLKFDGDLTTVKDGYIALEKDLSYAQKKLGKELPILKLLRERITLLDNEAKKRELE